MLDEGGSSYPMRTSPHFKNNRRENGQSGESVTEDGDEIDESSNNTGFKVGGVRYLLPNKLGASFATAEDVDGVQDDFFVGGRQSKMQMLASEEDGDMIPTTQEVFERRGSEMS